MGHLHRSFRGADRSRPRPQTLLPVSLLLLTLPAAAAAPDWRASVSATVRQSYDSNVYLQDIAPATGVAGALPAQQGSWVSALALGTKLDWKPGGAFQLQGGYAPEALRFHAARAEDHVVHRLHLQLTGRAEPADWSWQNFVTRIDGTSTAPVFGGAHGAPALGAIPVRDRRDAVIVRSQLRLTLRQGAWLLRPSATAYHHDFQTEQTSAAGCANYIDRRETLAGVDIGREIAANVRIFAGFRAGRQEQGRLFDRDSPFDCTVRRLLLGIEATPRPWLQFSAIAGHDDRAYAAGTPAAFDASEKPLWLDATASATFAAHTFTLNLRRQRLPASSSVGVYDDTAAEANWRWQPPGRFSSVIGVKLARGQWAPPAVRDDVITSPGALLRFAPRRDCSTELGWTFDRGRSRVPLTGGRDFRRHTLTAAITFTR